MQFSSCNEILCLALSPLYGWTYTSKLALVKVLMTITETEQEKRALFPAKLMGESSRLYQKGKILKLYMKIPLTGLLLLKKRPAENEKFTAILLTWRERKLQSKP